MVRRLGMLRAVWVCRSPLITDHAGTVSPGDPEFEAGGVWRRDYGFPFGVTSGVLPVLQAGIGSGAPFRNAM